MEMQTKASPLSDCEMQTWVECSLDPLGEQHMKANIEIPTMSGKLVKSLVGLVPKKILIAVLGCDRSNFSKLVNRKRLTKLEIEAIQDLLQLWGQLLDFFDNDKDLLIEWLNTPLVALSGIKPYSLLTTIQSRRYLRRVLTQMSTGGGFC